MTAVLSTPNLALATTLMLHGPGLPAWISCGSLSLFGIYNLVALVVASGRVERLKRRAVDGTQHHDDRRRDAIRVEGWLCRAFLLLTSFACLSLLGMRSG
jgi:hypothetical protein